VCAVQEFKWICETDMTDKNVLVALFAGGSCWVFSCNQFLEYLKVPSNILLSNGYDDDDDFTNFKMVKRVTIECNPIKFGVVLFWGIFAGC